MTDYSSRICRIHKKPCDKWSEVAGCGFYHCPYSKKTKEEPKKEKTELKPYVFEETQYGLINYLERIAEAVNMHPRARGAVMQAMLLVQAMSEEEYQDVLVRAKEDWNRRSDGK